MTDMNPLAAIRVVIDGVEDYSKPDTVGLAFEAIEQLLDRFESQMMVHPNLDVVAWLQMKSRVAHKAGDTATGRVLEVASEDLLSGLHIDGHARHLRQFFLEVHESNVKAGWWTDIETGEPKKRSVGEMFMLMVTELAEAYNAYVCDNAADDKLPQYAGLGVELGDTGIRLADFCGALLTGRIVAHSDAKNPGDAMFNEICDIASRYELIRKTDAAKGEPEQGDYLEPQDVAEMIDAKLAFNASREDHKVENRLKEGGKRT